MRALRDFLFTDPETEPRDEAPLPAARALPPSVALLARGRDAGALGCALGLLLARGTPALVCRWGVDEHAGVRAPARPSAVQLGRALRARGHMVSVAGRLAVVTLGGEPAAAAAEAGRAIAAAGEAATVLALAARDPAFDGLLGGHDLVVVATPPGEDALRALALAALAPLGGRTIGCAVAPATGAGLAARSGLAVAPSLARGLDGVLEALVSQWPSHASDAGALPTAAGITEDDQ